jgi:hypothetical protein
VLSGVVAASDVLASVKNNNGVIAVDTPDGKDRRAIVEGGGKPGHRCTTPPVALFKWPICQT